MAFTNRETSNPGRVKLIPVADEANTYTLTKCDNPSIEGTPLTAQAISAEINEVVASAITNNNSAINASIATAIGNNNSTINNAINEEIDELRQEVMEMFGNVWVNVYTEPEYESESSIKYGENNDDYNGSWLLPSSVISEYDPMKNYRVTVVGSIYGETRESSASTYYTMMSCHPGKFIIPSQISNGVSGKFSAVLKYDADEDGIKHTYSFAKGSNYGGTFTKTGSIKLIKVEQQLELNFGWQYN